MIKTLSLGQANYDIYVSVDTFPQEGTKTRFINKIGCGGGTACNVSYMLAKWGVSSTFAGVVGNDVYGTRVRKELESAGVDTRYIETSYEKDTVLAFNILDSSKKVPTKLEVADEYVKLKKFDFDFQPDLIILDGGDTYASKQTIERFPRAISVLKIDRFNQDIATVALKVNYLICSLDFASDVMKSPVDKSNVSSLVNCYTELRNRFEHQNIIITLGSNGAMYLVDDQIKISPALKMDIVDTSGCGDIFTGAFCYGLAASYPLEKAIKYGNIAAGLATRTIGGRLSIPKLDEVNKIYEKNN